jgi:hypothetical protein
MARRDQGRRAGRLRLRLCRKHHAGVACRLAALFDPAKTWRSILPAHLKNSSAANARLRVKRLPATEFNPMRQTTSGVRRISVRVLLLLAATATAARNRFR